MFLYFVLLSSRRLPSSTSTDTRCPYTTPVRSGQWRDRRRTGGSRSHRFARRGRRKLPDRDGPAPLGEFARDHIAIAAIVAGSAKDKHMIGTGEGRNG